MQSSNKKGKAPAAAIVSLTDTAVDCELRKAPSSSQGAATDPEELLLLAEIRATTGLLVSFNQWTQHWESLEVRRAESPQHCPLEAAFFL